MSAPLREGRVPICGGWDEEGAEHGQVGGDTRRKAGSAQSAHVPGEQPGSGDLSATPQRVWRPGKGWAQRPDL